MHQRIFGLAFALALALAPGCAPGERAAAPERGGGGGPDASPVTPASPGDEARELLRRVNEARQAQGLSPLRWSGALAAIAERHNDDMIARRYFAHEAPDGTGVDDRARAAGVTFRMIGENLAIAPSVEGAHRTLMRSPGHRENILRPAFDSLGIAVRRAPEGFVPERVGGGTAPLEAMPARGLGGHLIVTQVFGHAISE